MTTLRLESYVMAVKGHEGLRLRFQLNCLRLVLNLNEISGNCNLNVSKIIYLKKKKTILEDLNNSQ